MSRAPVYALAGLQAGISGALGLLLWLALASRFFGKSIWWSSNLLASAFYGDASLKFGFARYTFVGAALVLFVYGVFGILFGLAWRDRTGGLGAAAVALILSVLAYYLLFKTIWHHYSPEGSIYAPDRQIFVGHLVFGLLLARYPRFRDQSARLVPDERVAK